jgi:hypothetical protein
MEYGLIWPCRGYVFHMVLLKFPLLIACRPLWTEECFIRNSAGKTVSAKRPAEPTAWPEQMK